MLLLLLRFIIVIIIIIIITYPKTPSNWQTYPLFLLDFNFYLITIDNNGGGGGVLNVIDGGRLFEHFMSYKYVF